MKRKGGRNDGIMSYEKRGRDGREKNETKERNRRRRREARGGQHGATNCNLQSQSCEPALGPLARVRHANTSSLLFSWPLPLRFILLALPSPFFYLLCYLIVFFSLSFLAFIAVYFSLFSTTASSNQPSRGPPPHPPTANPLSSLPQDKPSQPYLQPPSPPPAGQKRRAGDLPQGRTPTPAPPDSLAQDAISRRYCGIVPRILSPTKEG